MSRLSINDKVIWRGGWGSEPPQVVTVTSIERNCKGKYGDPVAAIPWDEVNSRSVIVSLDNGHWAYGNQLELLT